MIEMATAEDLMARVDAIRPVIEANAELAEAGRRLPDAVYDALIGAGLFRMLVPRAFGGMELHPVDAYRVWEAVGRIDTAAGWNLMIGSASGLFAAWLSAQAAEEIYSQGPDVVLAGSAFPPAAAVQVDGGWRVSGRAPFASGCDRANWFWRIAIEMDGDAPRLDPATGQPAPKVIVLPRSDVEVIDTWHTVGMRGTGSSDVAFEDVFVPAHRAGLLGPNPDPPAAFRAPLFRLGVWPGLHGETIASLAAASAAIDKLLDLGQRKTPAMLTTPLRERAMAQHHVAKAQALVDAGREYLYSAISEAFAAAEKGEPLRDRTKLRCQLAACYAAEASAKAVDLVHEAAGTSAIRTEEGFERHFRDVHTLTQHASKSAARYENSGKLMFGLPHEWFVFDL